MKVLATPYRFLTYPLKITFKPSSKSFFNLFKIPHPPLTFEHLNIRIFRYCKSKASKHSMLIKNFIHALCRFTTLRAISTLFSFFIQLFLHIVTGIGIKVHKAWNSEFCIVKDLHTSYSPGAHCSKLG